MTDAALPVTQSTVERFTRQYLEALGCSVEANGDRWTVSVPADVDAPIGNEETVELVCSSELREFDDETKMLHPESQIFQQVVDSAAEMVPVGKIEVSSRDAALKLPDWLTDGALDVIESSFAPYYDRSAVTVLFQVAVETVSEYQTELLQAVTVDIRSGKALPRLTEEYLDLTSVESGRIRSEEVELSRNELRSSIGGARERVSELAQPKIDEIHGNASRAADAELEEYRRLQQQRMDELADEIVSVSAKIDGLSESVRNAIDQAERKKALRDRKRHKSELEEIESELDDLKRRRENGFPEKQREIRERHALEVSIEPIVVTVVEYERGELDLVITDGDGRHSLTVGYGSGLGVMDAIECDTCGTEFSEVRLPKIDRGEFVCVDCYSR